MPILLMVGIVAVMVGTAFLSGIFGMAGGMILIGVLLAVMPVADAMALHAVTQMASNAWRAALWYRYISWRPVGAYCAGALLALILWSINRYVPGKAMAMLLLGATPFVIQTLPGRIRPNPAIFWHGILNGLVCMALLLLTGVAGPMIDRFFLGGNLDRRQIVASKAACQVFGHFAKLIYFAGLIDQTARLDWRLAAAAILASMLGTSLARKLLEAMTDAQFRRWAGRIITTICAYYVAYGLYLLAVERGLA